MKDRFDLTTVKETLTTPLRQATLCFLVRDNQVLLAMKKRGFAQGKWNGAGGKKDERDSNVKEAAIRETSEEIGVRPKTLKLTATLNFYHLGKEDNNQQVTVYLCDKWEGEPTESEEMAPKWFDLDKIPYKDMWVDDIIWMPMILGGETIEADFLFDEKENLLELHIRKILTNEK
jgi:8-oxo-dGTP pyrophosphatase MutT (NUDIX family)